MEKTSNKKIKVTGIILSAGFSRRMNGFKPLLKLSNGKTFLVNVTEKLIAVCDEILVVTGFNTDSVEEELKTSQNVHTLKIVFNENYEMGMFSSLQKAMAVSKSDWFLYHFVDQPSLEADFYSNFISEIEEDINWIQPIYKGRKGHPILFDESVKQIIMSGDFDNLKSISYLPRLKKKFFEYNSELIHQDIDTREEFVSLS